MTWKGRRQWNQHRFQVKLWPLPSCSSLCSARSSPSLKKRPDAFKGGHKAPAIRINYTRCSRTGVSRLWLCRWRENVSHRFLLMFDWMFRYSSCPFSTMTTLMDVPIDLLSGASTHSMNSWNLSSNESFVLAPIRRSIGHSKVEKQTFWKYQLSA